MAAELTAPLDALRNEKELDGLWTDAHTETFEKVKALLLSAPPLAYPRFNQPFFVATDASSVGIGAVLYQIDPKTKKKRWISFQARSLSKSERNYSATKRELLAIVFALARFHHHIWGSKFTLFTDHAALVFLHTQKTLNGMMTTWYETLFAYDFKVYHKPRVRNILPDHLSRFFSDRCAQELGGDDVPMAQGGPEVRAAVVELGTTLAESPVQPEEQKEPVVEPAVELPVAPEEKRAELLDTHHLLGHLGTNSLVKAIQAAGWNWPGYGVGVVLKTEYLGNNCMKKIKRAGEKTTAIRRPGHVTRDRPTPHYPLLVGVPLRFQ